MRIAIVTDAWAPQVNGVVRTLGAVRAELQAMGHHVAILAPDAHPSIPCPTYPEIRLAVLRPGALGRRLAATAPHAIHIATEGPLGLAARRWCIARRLPFTTAYHTQFPDYVSARTRIPAAWIWRYVRWFHAPAAAVLASTPGVEASLNAHGLPRVRRWGRGVDLDLFTPDGPVDAAIAALPRPIHLYVGRVAIEKNLHAFLATPTAGSKAVVGDGPARAALEQRFPQAHFLGSHFGAALAAAYRSADVFVFPSRTDTFGLVMIEALACGTPVAALPVTGPLDLIGPRHGALDEDLSAAILRALQCDRQACASYGRSFSWRRSAQEFLDALVPLGNARRAA